MFLKALPYVIKLIKFENALSSGSFIFERISYLFPHATDVFLNCNIWHLVIGTLLQAVAIFGLKLQ